MKTLKILKASQIKALDAFTIQKEGISSVDLMERASVAFMNWFLQKYFHNSKLSVNVFCGLGNNGGDGLAIARLLIQKGFSVNVFVAQYAEKTSTDFEINLRRLQELKKVFFIKNEDDFKAFQQITANDIIIDAILGAGINRAVDGLLKALIIQLNELSAEKISVDIASGLFMDEANTKVDVIFKPNFTITFQLPKLALMLPQNYEHVGEWEVLDIGLNQEMISELPSYYFYTQDIQPIARPKFSHKGTFGHTLLLAGSKGMMGAAILSAKACLHSGVGKLTCHVPNIAFEIMQIAVPEAMTWTSSNDFDFISTNFTENDLSIYQSIAIGPGIGTHPDVFKMLESVILSAQDKKLVIDAGALNLLATEEGKELLNKLPRNTILTPHPKEFQKLLGKTWKDDYEKLALLQTFAQKYQIFIVLKGYQSAVATPEGDIYFNATGNAGMATGGSGDVLTGIIAALLAQNYSAKEATILGVFKHGEAGDLAAETRGQMAMIASDIIENLRW
ncbi:NAD(P)H-hydrate dehydratase [Arcicella lustrica]|uniref:Bifunctional NAD(P)H-hydrate repair enzyme n=1 Tax=Arcicella lustrica TaxID=2984196 RepID=A0ABU5SFM0_9BACT|nr:NAD(P)H-hydrate dehydratase [Arcicella sp. DC25W]MEA5426082.1 NAD(P)H-hydrate dehydratase [Arcicella sp. DC25W]